MDTRTRIDEPIALPQPAPMPPRRSWPLFASIMPLVGGGAMWLITGSLVSLCFAALSPLMAIASVFDRRRGSTRERRRAEDDYVASCGRAEQEIASRHLIETEQLRRELPDARALCADELRLWRADGDALVLGEGEVPSRVHVTGGEGEHAQRLRSRAAVLESAPIAIDLADGVCVRGDRVAARAVARALVLQACLRLPPDELCVTGVAEPWLDLLPHRKGAGRRLELVHDGSACAEDADIVIASLAAEEAVPARCGAVIDLDGLLTGTLVRGVQRQRVDVEAFSEAQAQQVASRLAQRMPERRHEDIEPVLLADLEPMASTDLARLPAAIGTAQGAAAVIDLVADGPHAVIVGTTGAGKSELLLTLVTSLARTYTPDRVVFLLADFKGGTAFEPLAALPHVTGVITDLDGDASRRAVESLRAELRRREARMAVVGARDIAHPGVDLPRLVIVVDEFAAMLADHPDLHAVFTDVAARGRALGMHLVLGTQRSTGVMRDGLVANAPLRIALRVSERSESKGLIGTEQAAELPGGVEGRGLAYVRRAGDAAPVLTRIALTSPETIAALTAPDGAGVQGPWLPPLPRLLTIEQCRSHPGGDADVVLLGIADEPDAQRQPAVVLRVGAERGLAAIGGSGSGKSALARLVAVQRSDATVVPRDAEGAWDAIERAEHEGASLLVIDDLDAVIARYPHDYASAMAERIETLVRDAGERRMTVVMTAARLTGQISRILDLIPRRAILSLATRADHAAAGGEAGDFDARRVPGRAALDGREVQFAFAPEAQATPQAPPALWQPTAPLTALVLRAAHRRVQTLAEAWPDVHVVELDDAAAVLPQTGRHPTVVVGEAESWQRQWALLNQVRSHLPIVIGAECAGDIRGITGERELPPYARTRAGRAWVFADGAPPLRVVLP
ncbi:MAG: FtsK/SpoIIIE domain-containing protein [Microbacterium sp.]